MNDPMNNWAKSGMNHVVQTVLRGIFIALALFLMAIAVPLFFLPIPLGLPLFILSLILLAASSKRAHALITGYLQRHPGVWKRVRHIFDRFHK